MTSVNAVFIELKNEKLVTLSTKYIQADALPHLGDSVFLIAGYQHHVVERHFTYGSTLQVDIFVEDRRASLGKKPITEVKKDE